MKSVLLSSILAGGLWLSGCSSADFKTEQVKPASTANMPEAILEEVNRLRANRKLQPLKNDPELSALALSYSKQMARTNHFDHSDVNGKRLENRLEAAGITSWTMAGENLAKTINAPEPAKEATRGWQLSQGHSENLYNADYDYAGTGVYFKNNECYITQIYMKKSSGM